MMSKKQLACMLTLHIIYLLLGASIFYHIESPLEMAQRGEEKLERLEIQSELYNSLKSFSLIRSRYEDKMWLKPQRIQMDMFGVRYACETQLTKFGVIYFFRDYGRQRFSYQHKVLL